MAGSAASLITARRFFFMELKNFNTRLVAVSVGGETLNVKRRAVTFDDWQQITERYRAYQAAQEKADKKTKPDNYPLIQNLCQIVTDLDLTIDGAPVPVTPETLLRLDVRVLVAIHDAVLEDANPNPAKP